MIKEDELFEIKLGSFNLNGQPCLLGDLKRWLYGPTKYSSDRPSQTTISLPDMIVLGFQEFDITTQSYFRTDPIKRLECTKLITQCLNEMVDEEDDQLNLPNLGEKTKAITTSPRQVVPIDEEKSYALLEAEGLTGMLILVYLKQSKCHLCHQTAKANLSVGRFRWIGNKGAVAIRMSIGNNTFCFVNAHLTPHRDKWQKRNEDYHMIMNQLIFRWEDSPSLTHSKSKFDPSSVYQQRQQLTLQETESYVTKVELNIGEWIECSIMDHDYVFFLGDLNYRIEMDTGTILGEIETRQWNRLLEYDQLILSKSVGEIFTKFEEPKITFPPTFKFYPNSSQYHVETSLPHSIRASHPQNSETERVVSALRGRSPGWCDRILVYKSDPSYRLVYLEYGCAEEVKISDHRPIYGLFRVALSSTPKEPILRRRYSTRLKIFRQFQYHPEIFMPWYRWETEEVIFFMIVLGILLHLVDRIFKNFL
jgi:hypothetical protein